MDTLNPNCIICTAEFHSESTGMDHEDIELAVFNGWSYRDVAKKVVEIEGSSLHAWEQLVRKHCIKHVDWKAYGCPICSVGGENLINRWVIEKALRENREIRKALELKEYFSLFTNSPGIDPTGSEMIQRLEFHRSVCMLRYRAKRAIKSDEKKDNNTVKEKTKANGDYYPKDRDSIQPIQAVL